MTSKSNSIIETITNMILNKMLIGQTIDINAKSVEASLVKNEISLLVPQKVMQETQITFSSYCSLLTSTNLSANCDKNQVISQKVKQLFLTNFLASCHYS